MQAIREEDRIKAVVLVAATVGIFGFIGFQVYGATKPAAAPTVSANRTVTQGEAQAVDGGTPAPSPTTAPTTAPNTSVSVSGVQPNQVDPFRTVLGGPKTGGPVAPIPRPNPLPPAGGSGTGTINGGNPVPTLPPTGPNIASIAPVLKGSILGNRRAAVLTINGRDIILNEGEMREGVRLLRVTRDQAVIRLDGTKEAIILKIAP